MSYPFSEIELKWQKLWQERGDFVSKRRPGHPKYYVLDMFPYPSSTGLHVGHPEGYTATDIIARAKRAQGFDVLHPMGWDAFGLPAEQFAIQTGVHPEVTTAKAIQAFKSQLMNLGFSYDWSREISTCDANYYKWTQWIFLRLYERGLAVQREVAVNWCPALKTVLANEEVVDGKSERGGHPVHRKPMRQWMLKITDYAERLLEGLDRVDWPEGTKELQRNWIGKSVGLELAFSLADSSTQLRVFTTRADTLGGVSFLAVSPEHEWVAAQCAQGSSISRDIQAYVEQAQRKSEMDRQDGSKEKTGIFTGIYAINPLNDARIPIFVADYVLATYGTGAVMGVPAHDERDHAFAIKYNLPINVVITSSESSSQAEAACMTGLGTVQHTHPLVDGQSSEVAMKWIANWAQEKGCGQAKTQYKFRDWLFSRQRYWGEPFPLVYWEEGTPSAVADEELPIRLPAVDSYEPLGTGESPLAGIESYVRVVHETTGAIGRRETDTMPGSAASSWYFLRFCDPHNQEMPFSREALEAWGSVDLYLGGKEHAVGHLLYARFWTKVLFDMGLVPFDEPFQKLVHQGMILGEDGEKMSKSRGNVINPDVIVREFGADSLRLYEMFMGPLDRDKPWSTGAIGGVFRFLSRAYRLVFQESGEKQAIISGGVQEEDLKLHHQTIHKVTQDTEHLRFNTAISAMMIYVNHFTKRGGFPSVELLREFAQILAPYAPHIAEEFWLAAGRTDVLSIAPWPKSESKYLQEDSVQMAVQVMGKTRGAITVAKGLTQAEVEAAVKADPSLQRSFVGKSVQRVIFVPNKIINFLVKDL